MGENGLVLSGTWRVDCKIDNELRTYKIEHHKLIGKWEAITLLLKHLSATYEGLSVVSSLEAIPVKAPLIEYF